LLPPTLDALFTAARHAMFHFSAVFFFFLIRHFSCAIFRFATLDYFHCFAALICHAFSYAVAAIFYYARLRCRRFIIFLLYALRFVDTRTLYFRRLLMAFQRFSLSHMLFCYADVDYCSPLYGHYAC